MIIVVITFIIKPNCHRCLKVINWNKTKKSSIIYKNVYSESKCIIIFSICCAEYSLWLAAENQSELDIYWVFPATELMVWENYDWWMTTDWK